MATRAEIESMNVQELKQFVSDNGDFLQDSLDNLEENRVSGKTFLTLDDDELREMFPRLGERKAFKNLINTYQPKQMKLYSNCTVWLSCHVLYIRLCVQLPPFQYSTHALCLCRPALRCDVLVVSFVGFVQASAKPTSPASLPVRLNFCI